LSMMMISSSECRTSNRGACTRSGSPAFEPVVKRLCGLVWGAWARGRVWGCGYRHVLLVRAPAGHRPPGRALGRALGRAPGRLALIGGAWYEHAGMREYLVLAVGVLIASSAAIMIRFAQADGMPSLTIAAGRLAIAALVLQIVSLRAPGSETERAERTERTERTRTAQGYRAVGLRRGVAALRGRACAAPIAAGAFLALHFASWITSLEHTSVASSVALVATNPVWVAIVSHFVMRERVGKAGGLAVVLTVLGSVLLGISGTLGHGVSAVLAQTSLRGDVLALLGAVAASAYLLIGRRARNSVPLLRYLTIAYSTSAVLLLGAASLSGAALLGHAPRAYFMVVGLALGPQLLGHGAFNYAVRRLSATVVAVAIVGEPVGSAVLAYLLLGERLASIGLEVAGRVMEFPIQLLGLSVLVVGILSAAYDEQRRRGMR